jgi:hypothetical protein
VFLPLVPAVRNHPVDNNTIAASSGSERTSQPLIFQRWFGPRRVTLPPGKECVAMNHRAYIAEAIGTFWLIFGGCGSAVIAAGFPQVGIGLLGVALASGLTVVTMAYAIGHISGCHLMYGTDHD